MSSSEGTSLGDEKCPKVKQLNSSMTEEKREGGGGLSALPKPKLKNLKAQTQNGKTGGGGLSALPKPNLKNRKLKYFSVWTLAKPKDPPPSPSPSF